MYVYISDWLLTVVKVVILQQAKDAQSQYEYAAYIKIVAFAPHCPCVGQGYQYTA